MSSLILPLTTRRLVYRSPSGRGLVGITLQLFPGETLGLLGPKLLTGS
jgi:hypothetical protein